MPSRSCSSRAPLADSEPGQVAADVHRSPGLRKHGRRTRHRGGAALCRYGRQRQPGHPRRRPASAHDSAASSFNSAAADDAASWERAAKNYESQQQWDKAGDAWKSAAHLWGPKVGALAAGRRRLRAGRADYAPCSKYDKIAASWTTAANDFDGAGAVQMESIAWDRAAVAYAPDGEVGQGRTVLGVRRGRAAAEHDARLGERRVRVRGRSPG